MTLTLDLSVRNRNLSYTRDGEYFHKLWSSCDFLLWTDGP